MDKLFVPSHFCITVDSGYKNTPGGPILGVLITDGSYSRTSVIRTLQSVSVLISDVSFFSIMLLMTQIFSLTTSVSCLNLVKLDRQFTKTSENVSLEIFSRVKQKTDPIKT